MGGSSTLGLVLQINAEDAASPELAQVKTNVGQFAAGASADFENIGKSGVFAFEEVQHKLIESTREMAKLRAEILATNDAAERLRLTEKLKEAQAQFTATRTEMRGMRLEMTEATEKANLFAEQFGVHIPAEMTRLIARIPGVQTALASLFEVGIVFAFVRGLAEVITKWGEFGDKVGEAIEPIAEAEFKIGQAIGLFKDMVFDATNYTVAWATYAQRSIKVNEELFKKQEDIYELGLKGSDLEISRFQHHQDQTAMRIRDLNLEIEKQRELAAESGKKEDAAKLGELLAQQDLATQMKSLDAVADQKRIELALTEEQEKASKKAEEAAKKAARAAEEAERKRGENLKREEEQALRAAKEIQDLTLKMEGADPALVQYYNRLLEIQDAYGDTALAAQIATLATQVFLKEEHDKTEKLKEETDKFIQDHGVKAEKPEVAEAHMQLLNRTLAEMKGHVSTLHNLYGAVTIQQLEMHPALLANAKAWDEQFASIQHLAGSAVFKELVKNFGLVKVASNELKVALQDAMQNYAAEGAGLDRLSQKFAQHVHELLQNAQKLASAADTDDPQKMVQAQIDAALGLIHSYRIRAAIEAIYYGAKSVASFAAGDIPQGVLYAESAALFAVAAGTRSSIASSIGGGGSGGGGSRAGSGYGGGGGGRYGGSGRDDSGAVPIWASAAGQALTPAQRALAMGAPGTLVLIMGDRRSISQQVLGLHNEAIKNGGLPAQSPRPPYSSPGNGR